MIRTSCLLLILSLGAAFVSFARVDARPLKVGTGIAGQNGNAAFRDGLYQAKIQAEAGRRPHVTCGRWTGAADRTSFIAGYQKGYRQFLATHPEDKTILGVDEVVGFRDGVRDGVRDRDGSQPFHTRRAMQFRPGTAQVEWGSADPTRDTPRYRCAYSNGYQQGYYEQRELQGFEDRS